MTGVLAVGGVVTLLWVARRRKATKSRAAAPAQSVTVVPTPRSARSRVDVSGVAGCDVRRLLRWLVDRWQRSLWGLLASVLPTRRFLDLIDATGIVIFVGPNGSGKSLAAVMSCLRVLDGETWECSVLSHRHNRPVARHYDACEECQSMPVGGVCPVAGKVGGARGRPTGRVFDCASAR